MIEFAQICIGGLVVGCVYALIALGFSLVYRVTGAINLAQGGFCILGALLGYTLSQSLGWPLMVALPAAVILTTIGGALLGAISFVPGLSRLSNANTLMLTVGLLTMLEGLSLVVWGSQSYALPPFSGDQPVDLGGLLVPTQAFWVFGTAVLIVVALVNVIGYTKFGRALRACAENGTAASLMGIDVPRMTLMSFAIAAAIAAVAGVVVAPTTTLQFDSGRLFTISGFIAVVVGGIASFPGAIAGGLLLGLATQLATAYVSSLFSNAIALLILLVVLVWRPTGVIGARVARRADVRDETRAPRHLIRLKPNMAWSLSTLSLVVAVFLPLAVTSNGIMSGLTIAAILFIALIGLDVLMGFTGQVSLGQAGFMAIGGYTAGYLALRYDMPPVVGILAGMVLSVACALVLSLVTLRLRGLYLALATLAFGLLVDSCAVGFIDVTGGPSGMVGIPPLSVAGYEFSSPRAMYYLVLALIVVLLTGLFGALRMSFGRALKAIQTDQTAAAALGIDVMRYKLAAFLVSAALASLSGSLYALFFNFLSPDMVGTNHSLELVAMLIVGGEGSLVGPLFGSVMLTLLPTLFQPFALYKTFASGALLVACFLYLPQGIYGALIRVIDRPMARSSSATRGGVLVSKGVP